MTREYPDEPAGEFPSPPDTVTDGDGREIQIRPGGADDTEALVEMYLDFEAEDRAQGIPPVREEPIRDWLDVLLSDECLNVVALHDDEPIGHATLVPDEGESYELAIFVLRSYQGAGIGTHLLEHLLGHAQDEGVQYVWLTVERWNDPAIAVYKKVGFDMTSTESFELEMAITLK
ncbi:GNAT family N-acetyltransferase [Halorientalis sp. IM1011]|uniref:GNAT family N-acetyltransferase n=1 Tax=Halorientalis sp. IM1011 TaxID=1932360 RepID=UPI00097CCAFC|nr:GNAT family N-acetyltransferase [Halorientalis sp. IM1011]AQL43114.1 GNAT family N-acetyltransferase [Halorientalis sp. IM1011]